MRLAVANFCLWSSALSLDCCALCQSITSDVPFKLLLSKKWSKLKMRSVHENCVIFYSSGHQSMENETYIKFIGLGMSNAPKNFSYEETEIFPGPQITDFIECVVFGTPYIVTLPILYCKLQKKTQLQKKERDQRWFIDVHLALEVIGKWPNKAKKKWCWPKFLLCGSKHVWHSSIGLQLNLSKVLLWNGAITPMLIIYQHGELWL